MYINIISKWNIDTLRPVFHDAFVSSAEAEFKLSQIGSVMDTLTRAFFQVRLSDSNIAFNSEEKLVLNIDPITEAFVVYVEITDAVDSLMQRDFEQALLKVVNECFAIFYNEVDFDSFQIRIQVSFKQSA